MANLQCDISYGAATQRRLDEYREGVRLLNAGQDANHQEALQAWEIQKAAIDAAHAAAMMRWKRGQAGFKKKQASWQKAHDIYEIRREGFTQARFQTLGVIYEYIREAGPRGINGLPCFFSFRMLNQEDWARAHKAIMRELQRRESLEI